MNNVEFKQVCAIKRYLALNLALNSDKALNNEENRLAEAANDYYQFVHDALYVPEAAHYIFESVLEDARLCELNEFRLMRFNQMQDVVDEFAHEVYVKMDNGEIGL